MKTSCDTKTAANYKNCHYLCHCPVEGCKAVIKRLPPHLKNVSKMTRDNEVYNEFLCQAKRAAIINEILPLHRTC